MIGHRHKLARFQSDFYRNCYRKSLNVLLLSIFIMLCLIAAIVYVIFAQPVSGYYASTTNGQIIPMIPQTK